MGLRMKALKFLLVGVAALLVLGVAILIFGVPAGFLTSAIKDRVEKETGYRLEVAGKSRLSLLPHPLLELRDVTLSDPRDVDGDKRFAIESLQADISVRSLFSGSPRLRELTIVQPVVTLPLIRERSRQLSGPKKTTIALPEGETALPIDLITVTNGTLIMRNTRERLERRLDSINIKAVSAPDHQLIVTADAKSGEQPIRIEAKATIAGGKVDGLTVPVDFKFDAPGILPQSVSGNGEIRLSGSTVTLNGLTGMFGNARFSGSASAELNGKPIVKADLDFQRLDFEEAKTSLNSGSESGTAARSDGGWSTRDIDLRGLNFVDGQLNVSAATLGLGALRLAPVKIESTVENGILRMSLAEIGLYEGQAAAGFAIDASVPTPVYALRANLANVRALQLLTSIADFTSIDGRMQGQFDVRSMGRNQSELMSNMAGTATFNFRDGQIIGINVADMVRSLTTSTLSGWQQDKPAAAQGTDLTELVASFQIDKGQATTNDLRLAGPLVRMTGTGAINLANRTLAFRMEPKLVMTAQGQGGPADPVGLGVPVVVDGPWSSPRIYPEMSGILDNPEAAFGKLREMGQGLFGPGMLGGGDGKSDNLIGNIGNMIKGLGTGSPQAQTPAQPVPADPKPADSKPADARPSTAQPPAASPDKPFPIDRIIRDLFGR